MLKSKTKRNETPNNASNPHEFMLIIYCYEDIIKTQNKKAIGCIGNQGQRLKKFKDTEHVFSNFGQSRSIIYCKVSL